MSYFARIFLLWEMFQTNIVEKIKAPILCSVTFFARIVPYEKMWKNNVQWGRQKMTIWRMHIACRIPQAPNTHTQVVWHSLPFHSWTSVPHCYIIRTLPVLHTFHSAQKLQYLEVCVRPATCRAVIHDEQYPELVPLHPVLPPCVYPLQSEALCGTTDTIHVW